MKLLLCPCSMTEKSLNPYWEPLSGSWTVGGKKRWDGKRKPLLRWSRTTSPSSYCVEGPRDSLSRIGLPRETPPSSFLGILSLKGFHSKFIDDFPQGKTQAKSDKMSLGIHSSKMKVWCCVVFRFSFLQSGCLFPVQYWLVPM